MRRLPRQWPIVVCVCGAALAGRAARADHDSAPPVEVPILVIEDDPGESAAQEESEVDLGQMVISAAKHVETIQDEASIVSVVTRQEIVDHGYQGLDDVIDTIPGFEGHRPAWTLAWTEAFARGNPRTVLYLWNGVPLNSPQNNRRALGPYLPLDAVDRVEVVSGPGGVLWGADAFLGIVSVTTRGTAAGDDSREAMVAVGGGPRSTGEYRATASIHERSADGWLGVHATVGVVTTRGPEMTLPYDVIAGPATAPDPDGTFTVRPSSGPLRGHADLWVPLSLRLDAGRLHLDVLYPLVADKYTELSDRGHRSDQLQNPDGSISRGESSQRAEVVTLASLSYERPLSAGFRLAGRAYFTGFEDRWARIVFEPPGLLGDKALVGSDSYAGMNRFLHDGAYRYGGSVDASREGASSALVFGGEAYVEGLRSVRGALLQGLMTSSQFVRYDAGERAVVACFAEDEYTFNPRLAVKVGARAQAAPGVYDPVVLGSVAGRLGLSSHTNLKLNVAQGFRPPAFEDTNGNDDAATDPYPHRQSNPELAPERSVSVESELSSLFYYWVGPIRRVAARAGYQYTRLDDLIVLDAGGVPQNSNRRVIHSIEARADALFRGGHRMVAGYGFLVGEDMTTGPLRNVPQHRLNLAFDAAFSPRWRGHVGLDVTGGSEDLNRLPLHSTPMNAVASPGVVIIDRMPASATVDVGLRAVGLVGDALDLAIDVANVFDAVHPLADPDFESRQAIFSVPSLGRSLIASVVWRM